MDSKNTFFQNENKFVVGKHYETLCVKSPQYNSSNVVDFEKCDEVGTIIPNTEFFLGKYVSSKHYGYGDNAVRYDYFINENGEKITNTLNYDGTTRYREVMYIEKK
jgi:hypothetical protein